MKRTALLIFLILITVTTLAQKADIKPAKEAKETEKGKSSSLPEGYGTLTWGTLLSQAKSKITGKLVFTDEKNHNFQGWQS